MVNITVDGTKYQIDEKKNLIDALKDLNIEVPHFCYHPKLSVAGMCRICLVEQVGNPKLQPACNLPIQEGLNINVVSEKAIKAREGVMEFQLINHPLDCPVCDKSGECELQNYSFSVGQSTTRYKEEKRNTPQEELGSNLIINHNRCILCYRCVRFDDEILGKPDLEFKDRGNQTIIAYTPPANSNETELHHNYQGALADICPVGALLNKNTLFTSRVWWFDQKPTTCHGCSTLCSVTSNVKNNEIFRYMPPENSEQNGYFICDKGRFSTPDFSKNRLLSYMYQGLPTRSDKFYSNIKNKITEAKSILWLGGSTESNEDIDALINLKQQLEQHDKKIVWEFKTSLEMFQNKFKEQEDFLLMKIFRPNVEYMLKQNLTSFESYEELKKELPTFDLVILINESSAPFDYLSINEEQVSNLLMYKLIDETHTWNKTLVLSTHKNILTTKAHATAPILSVVEKEGTFLNKEHKEKHVQKSIQPALGLTSSSNVMNRIFSSLDENKDATKPTEKEVEEVLV